MDDLYFDNLYKEVDSTIHLDEEQRNAIVYLGNSMIIAGAGSGKTTTMAAKVKYLVDCCGIEPSSIVVISYTNKAVEELRQRIVADFHIPCFVSTFHRFALRILRENGFNYSICSDAKFLLERFMVENKKRFKKKFLKYDFLSFLKIFKTYGYTFSDFDSFLLKVKGGEREVILLFRDFYYFYESYLNDHHMVDFEDIILKANTCLDHSKVFPFRYIIVDEYQDISYQRFLMILKVHQLCRCFIVAVGDDWQGIFEFAGADGDLFRQFCSLLPDVHVFQITHTYRNSQELISLAGKFVMKNSSQIKKNLLSSKSIACPLVLKSYLDPSLCLHAVLKKIVLEYGYLKNVLLLGRYQFDLDPFLCSKYFKREGNKIIWNSSSLSITFLTCHAAKGLGFDNVIILNGNSGTYGFPSMVKNSFLMDLLHKEDNSFLFASERRLFYVALTRTKNRVYLLSRLGCRSIFIKEVNKIRE